MGDILTESMKLSDIPKLKDSYTLLVMQRPIVKKEAIRFDNTKFRECRKMLKLNNGRKFFEMVLFPN